MLLANRLFVPDNTHAILWDMDGVLLDTLGFDVLIVNQLLHEHIGNHINIGREFIRSIFAYAPPDFLQLIRRHIKQKQDISIDDKTLSLMLDKYNSDRTQSKFESNPGIREILQACIDAKIRIAVVSNNPTEDVKKILHVSDIAEYFALIVGNDLANLKKKPAPDAYLYAIGKLGVKPEQCVVVEDSVLGAEAGHRAGCFVNGVATGANNFDALEQCQFTHQVCTAFEPISMKTAFGNVTRKKIYTPNEFVSHAIEHIAWRLCVEIDLNWNNNNWFELGKFIGEHIRQYESRQNIGTALGMIDDGSAEVLIELSEKPEFSIESVKDNLDWFLSLRCEQLRSGEPLINILKGLTQGLSAKIQVSVCSIEDPHHTWEGVFRSVGIALNQIFTPQPSPISMPESYNAATVTRETAETRISVSVDFEQKTPNIFDFNLSSSVDPSGFQEILDKFAKEAGFSINLQFNSVMLSSSHVLLEDTGLTLGQALKKILVQRMTDYGINGAGSSIRSKDDFENQPVRAGISVEGRKFWKILSFVQSNHELKKSFIIGQTIAKGLFSEDMDDFLDGLSGGLGCSIMVHIKDHITPENGWKMLMINLGKALKQAFEQNPYRKGVPPGVKATLA